MALWLENSKPAPHADVSETAEPFVKSRRRVRELFTGRTMTLTLIYDAVL